MNFDPHNSAVHLIHRVTQIAADRFATILNGTLTVRQVVIMAAIKAESSPTQTQIVTITGVDRSTVADMIMRLIKRRYVSRKRSKSDARANELKLTSEGENALAVGLAAMSRVELAELLNASKHVAMRDALATIVEKSRERGSQD
mgnify:CR=1 FL=1